METKTRLLLKMGILLNGYTHPIWLSLKSILKPQTSTNFQSELRQWISLSPSLQWVPVIAAPARVSNMMSLQCCLTYIHIYIYIHTYCIFICIYSHRGEPILKKARIKKVRKTLKKMGLGLWDVSIQALELGHWHLSHLAFRMLQFFTSAPNHKLPELVGFDMPGRMPVGVKHTWKAQNHECRTVKIHSWSWIFKACNLNELPGC